MRQRPSRHSQLPTTPDHARDSRPRRRPTPSHLATLLLLLTTPAALADTRYVDDDAPPGGDGLTWSTAHTHLQDALAEAVDDPAIDQIRIGQGTYRPDRDETNPTGTGDRTATFTMPDAVFIAGGYAGFGAPIPDAAGLPTILSGDLAADDAPDFTNRADNAFHVVTAPAATDNSARLSRVTIRAGNADAPAPDDSGAGIIIHGSPTLSLCTLTDCEAADLGAAAYVSSTGNPNFTNCAFNDNRALAPERGGAALATHAGAATVQFSSFSNNQASRGGAVFLSGIASLSFDNCSFTANTAGSRGGAIHIQSSTVETTVATLLDCSFNANAAGSGGAINNDNGTCTVTGCTFISNAADSDGGAIAGIGAENLAIGETNIADSSFELNTAAIDGGAIRLSGQVCSIACSSFTSNTAGESGGAFQIDKSDGNIDNCSFTDNQGGAGDPNFTGGAINIRLCAPTISGCVFIANRADKGGAIGGGGAGTDTQPVRLTGCAFAANEAFGDGGALAPSGPLGWEIDACTFDANLAASLGGALSAADNAGPILISDCRFSENSAHDGGAIKLVQSMSLQDCRIENNAAGRLGGAVFHRTNQTGATVFTAHRCDFIANTAGTASPLGTAGVYFADMASQAHFDHCLLLGNSSTRSVGVAEIRDDATATFTNCLINANTAAQNVGAISQGSTTVPDAVTITNCTIVNNTAGLGPIAGVSGAARIRNSILRANTVAATSTEATQLAPSATIDYCCVEGLTGALGGVGNTGADPLFIDPDGPDDTPATEDDDFRLTPGLSPCIDAADNNADTDLLAPGIQPLPTTDLQGGDRFLDDPALADTGAGAAPIIDMGALESGSVAPPAPPPSNIIYVDASATGANDGTTWADALTDLKDALLLADLEPNPYALVVRVAQGTYAPGPPGGPAASTFIVPSGILLEGGYDASTGQRNIALNPTILSGDLNADDAPGFTNRTDNAAHVVSVLCGSAAIDGVTIRGGNATSFGGAILAINGSLSLYNCTIEDNESVDAGGAAYIANASLSTTDTTFNANRTTGAASQGGAVFADLAARIRDTRGTFTSNTSRSGGALFMGSGSPAYMYLYGSTFHANSATGGAPSNGLGGAIATIGQGANLYAQASGPFSTTFSSNTARVGGAIYADLRYLSLNDTVLDNNAATEAGGAIYTLGRSVYFGGTTSMSGNSAPSAAGFFAGPDARTVVSAYPSGEVFCDAIVSHGRLYLSRVTLLIDGSFECTGEFGLDIDSQGTYGRVFATGDATIAGLLNVAGTSSYNSTGYLPPVGQTFTIIDAANRIGAFDTAYIRNFRFPDDRFLFLDYLSTGRVILRTSTVTPSRNTYYDAYVTGLGRADTATADLNNDGRIDLLLTTPYALAPDTDPGTALLLTNLGRSGSTWLGWNSVQQFSVGVFPWGLAVGQLDAPDDDGPDLDVACANFADDSVSVLRNLGGASGSWNGLGNLQSFAVGDGPIDLAIADFDLDGRNDVATANNAAATVSILLNQGGSGAGWLGLGQRIDIPTPGSNSPFRIEARDLDQDGDPDLIVTYRDARRVGVLVNDFISPARAGGQRSVTFSEGTSIDVEDGPADMIIEDLNADSFDDIAVVNQISGTLSIALGLGDGTFKPAVHLPVGDNPVTICCYDAEGDGDIDLAITDHEPDGPRVVRILRNDLDDGVLQFAEAEVLDAAENPFAVVAADVDGSGYADLIAMNDEPASPDAPPSGTSTNDIAVFLNDFVPPPPPCPGDLDDDDDTDVFDFALFAPAFGTQMGDAGFLPAADLNDDEAVDVFDFAIFAPDFGCTP